MTGLLRIALGVASLAALVLPSTAQVQVWTLDDDAPADFSDLQAATVTPRSARSLFSGIRPTQRPQD